MDLIKQINNDHHRGNNAEAETGRDRASQSQSAQRWDCILVKQGRICRRAESTDQRVISNYLVRISRRLCSRSVVDRPPLLHSSVPYSLAQRATNGAESLISAFITHPTTTSQQANQAAIPWSLVFYSCTINQAPLLSSLGAINAVLCSQQIEGNSTWLAKCTFRAASQFIPVHEYRGSSQQWDQGEAGLPIKGGEETATHFHNRVYIVVYTSLSGTPLTVLFSLSI